MLIVGTIAIMKHRMLHFDSKALDEDFGLWVTVYFWNKRLASKGESREYHDIGMEKLVLYFTMVFISFWLRMQREELRQSKLGNKNLPFQMVLVLLYYEDLDYVVAFQE